MAHHVARAACPPRLDHGINLRLGSSIDTLNLLRVRQVENRRLGIGHLDAHRRI